MRHSRRTFLAGAGAAGVLAGLAWPAAIRAAPLPIGRSVPGTMAPFKILEIFFGGGVSHRETFWVETPDDGALPRGRRVFDAISAPAGAPSDYAGWLPTSPTSHLVPGQLMRSSPSSSIYLGPAFAPLSGVPLDRARLVALGHDLPVHEIAADRVLKGRPATDDRARSFATGAAVQRHTGLPSFIFHASSQFSFSDFYSRLGAVGRHGLDAAPLQVAFGRRAALSIASTPPSAERAALQAAYTKRYDDLLTFAGPLPGSRARSRAFDAYQSASEVLRALPRYTSALAALTASASENSWENDTVRAIRASCALLNQGLSNSCMVLTEGVVSSIDAHGDLAGHTTNQTLNILTVTAELRRQVDAGTLDLSNTLVVLTSEFGRYFGDSGSEHSPMGFAALLLGGPIPNRGVAGDLRFSSGSAEERAGTAVGGLYGGAIDPTDLRAVLLQAAGIHPVQADCFTLADLRAEGESPEVVADGLCSQLLGV